MSAVHMCVVSSGHMIRMQLQLLDQKLDSILIGPPMPTTKDQIAKWCPARCDRLTFPGPILTSWTPPSWVLQTDDGGFFLAQNVVCYQRGREPAKLYDGFNRIAAVCFHHAQEETRQSLMRCTFDFFVFIVNRANTVVSGCAVELRPAKDRTQNPCLYISTVCTDPGHRKKGLGHQLIHAVYTLGMLLLENNSRATGDWEHAIQNNRLMLNLTVRHNETHDNLIKFYSQCGFRLYDKKTDMILYESFTPYSIYSWRLDGQPGELTPMYQEIDPNYVYTDESIRIMHPNSAPVDGTVKLYHEFPAAYLTAVKTQGIWHANHLCLIPNPAEAYRPEQITFSRKKPLGVYFCLAAITGREPVTLRISVPFWFASEIHAALTVT